MLFDCSQELIFVLFCFSFSPLGVDAFACEITVPSFRMIESPVNCDIHLWAHRTHFPLLYHAFLLVIPLEFLYWLKFLIS